MPEFKVKKLLTIPVLKFAEDKTRYVRVTSAMHIGKPQKAKEGEKAKEPATLMECVNLEDGTVCQVIVSAVIKSVLTDEYPGDAYVGKCFSITKRGRNPGKQYNQFDINEIDDPAEAAEVVSHPAARGRRA